MLVQKFCSRIQNIAVSAEVSTTCISNHGLGNHWLYIKISFGKWFQDRYFTRVNHCVAVNNGFESIHVVHINIRDRSAAFTDKWHTKFGIFMKRQKSSFTK